MEVPRYWRTQAPRYNLIGNVCVNCETKMFPAREVCPNCLTDRKGRSLSGEVKLNEETGIIIDMTQDIPVPESTNVD